MDLGLEQQVSWEKQCVENCQMLFFYIQSIV